MQPGIVFAMVAAALLHSGYGSEVSIRMPYLNPAGVTYIDHVNAHAPYAYTHGAPLQYAAAAVPAKIEAHHVGYAAAQVPAVAAVPFIKHVPTVSHVPVTKYEAQPVVLEKQVDVVKPALSTRTISVRRPAIQKQFYDVDIRPVGSSIVELDHPASSQTGPNVIDPVVVSHGGPFVVSSTPTPQIVSSTPASIGDDSIVVDNADFRKLPLLQNQFRLSEGSNERFIAHDPTPTIASRLQSSSEENQNNHNRIIEFLTGRGNLTKSDEGLSTRRLVYNTPIQILQDVNVVEPATKIERVSVQQPSFIKTARVDHVQVHGSVPVVGKALTPTVAHAAIPLYQKTISPAYEYYH